MDELHDDQDFRQPVEPHHLTAVRHLLGSHEPSPGTVAEGRARLLAEATATPTVSGLESARRRRHGRRGRRAGIGLSLAAVAAAAAVLVPMGLSGGGTSVVPHTGTSAPATTELTARQVLLAAAVAVEKAPASGDYWRIATVDRSTLTDPTRNYVIEKESFSEQWLAERPGLQSWRMRQYLGAKPATPRDEEAWRAAGAPTSWRYPKNMAIEQFAAPSNGRSLEAAAGERTADRLHGRWKGSAGSLMWDLISWQEARAIPGDPERLRAYLAGYIRRQAADPDYTIDVEKDTPYFLRGLCIQMLTDLPVSPEARASAYRILASLPGIRAEGEVTDPLGRRGQALGYREEAEPGLFTEVRFVVDPGTGLPLAEMRMNTAKGADGQPVELPSSTSYQAIGWTDERPEPPAHRD
ncbi:CU044_5270 family protein [Streptosporangium sp. NPDC048047]|uniref:CU044_5270 family protein n=1 Tax=Streptosporangium sp. NPDC048047 TaxID=3155748 RepID=UPI0034380939